MQTPAEATGCGSLSHFNRRTLLQAAGLSGLCWLTPLAEQLARAAEDAPRGATAKSVIVLWLQGGPSQLETFDPHPGDPTGGIAAIKTAAPEIQITELYPHVADEMASISLIRSVVSKEGDHERATYNVKTGFRPDPTLVHPAIGAVLCHQLSDNVEIPRHVSILPDQWSARGGYLGDQFDAFRVPDPQYDIPDVQARVPDPRFKRRLASLQNVVETEFARGRLQQLDERKTLHRSTIEYARNMMSSDQLKAFNVKDLPQALRDDFGDTEFGRGCLAAAQLIRVGVRCVEVTLRGWDTHAKNHSGHETQAKILDPAFAALIRYLREEKLLEHTIVLCGGEFGRTPRVNPVGGRDHWPHGFTVALAGGGIAGGRVIGATAPEPNVDAKDHLPDVTDPRNVADIHATLFHALGIQFEKELLTPIGRPMKISDGQVIRELLV